MRISFLRHGQTEHNEAGIWQGHDRGRLSTRGVEQAKQAAGRVGEFDVVLASDLDRALETAEVLGVEPMQDAAWRELDVGSWAGLGRQEVAERHGDQLVALRAGDPDVAPGGGEKLGDFHQRVSEAFDRIRLQLGEDDSALVITHGGVVGSLVASHWGLPHPGNRAGFVANTSFTEFEEYGSRLFLTRFNDAGHLGLPDHSGPHTTVALVRHGRTEANVAGLLQGQTDWGLDEVGQEQSEQFAAKLGTRYLVYTSPLRRAKETAEVISSDGAIEEGDLREMHFGEWENLDIATIQEGWPDQFERIFGQAEDLPRGGSGESVGDLTKRSWSALNRIVERHPGELVTAVAHGAVIRALVGEVLGPGSELFYRTGVLPNTGIAHVLFGERGPRLADYGIAPHLEGST